MPRLLLAAAVATAALMTAAPALAGGGSPPAPNPTVEPAPAQPIQPTVVVPGYGPMGPKTYATAHVVGVIRMTDCNAGSSAVRVDVDGRPATVTADDQGLTFRYDSGPVAIGHHTVVPTLAAGLCRGGAWTPGQRELDVDADQSGNADFDFRIARQTRTISAGVLRVLGSAIFSGLTIHLNNHDPIAQPWREDYYRAGDSYISYGPTMDRVGIDLPPTVLTWGTGPAYFYVNNVTAGNGVVGLAGPELKVSLFLRGDGTPEILGYQRNAIVGPPDIRMQNGRLDLYLLPTRDIAGRISYSKAWAEFSADISGNGVVGGLVDVATPVLALFMPSYRAQIKTGIEGQMNAFLDRRDTRERIASLMQAQMRAIGIGNVTDVRSTGDALIVEYQPAT